jgi:hypothetical protein
MAPNVIAKARYSAPGGARRAFYSGQRESNGNNYEKYIDDGAKKKSKYIDYADYSGNLEKSKGLFNSKGLMDDEAKKELRKKLKLTGSIVWDLLVSTETWYGFDHLQNWEDAQKMLKATMPSFFKDAGLDPNNMEWAAGLHENTDNRHIHILAFEKEPIWRKKGVDGYVYRSKGTVSQEALRNWKANIANHFLERSKDLGRVRNDAVNAVKSYFDSENSETAKKDIAACLSEAYNLIPKTGRISYGSDNMGRAKLPIDAATILILGVSGKDSEVNFALDELAKMDERKDAVSKSYRSSEKSHMREDYQNDLYRRCGNAIISELMALKDKEKKIEAQYHNKRQGQKHAIDYLLDVFYQYARWREKCEYETEKWLIEIQKMAAKEKLASLSGSRRSSGEAEM